MHLWTIADVKDCDVLVDVYGNVGIYKSHDDFSWLSYCSLGYYGGFQHFTIEHDNEKTYPATKEQRDTLFKAMADAEYTFDFEKKELKKIEQKQEENRRNLGGISSNWSEEDKKRIQRISDFIWKNRKGDTDDIYQQEQDVKWLKSLRPQNGWKPSEGQMEALKEACDEHWEPDGLDPLYTLYQELKKLREE